MPGRTGAGCGVGGALSRKSRCSRRIESWFHAGERAPFRDRALDPGRRGNRRWSIDPSCPLTLAGTVVEVLHDESQAHRNDPGRPLPAEITHLTGLTDDDVRGERIDVEAASALIEGSGLIVAHNARFDRPFVERVLPAARARPWACTRAEVPWTAEGLEGAFEAARGDTDLPGGGAISQHARFSCVEFWMFPSIPGHFRGSRRSRYLARGSPFRHGLNPPPAPTRFPARSLAQLEAWI